MDSSKKQQQQNYARPNSKACQSTDSNRKSSEVQSSKPWPKNSRRRENPSAARNEQQPHRNSKQQNSTKPRPNVDKRPRPRTAGNGGGGSGSSSAESYNGAACTAEDLFAAGTGLAGGEGGHGANTGGAMARSVYSTHDHYELNSIYMPGSKKQNLNHLLNFHYVSHESEHNVFGRGGGGGAARGGTSSSAGRRHKYNKEQFLQANFQFVIKSSDKPQLAAAASSPDTLIDWPLIEQINIQTTEEPQCPICLFPPIAAKLTRCGHAYCWPCILHYLALSDKTWRKCPICYEAIHTADLKSTAIVQQRALGVGDLVTFQLMRRKKGSVFIEKYAAAGAQGRQRFPHVSGNEEVKLFSKLLLAKRSDILEIIERERRELIFDEDPTCPEFVFIQQALDLLNERRDKLGHAVDMHEEEEEEEDDINEREEVVATVDPPAPPQIDDNSHSVMKLGSESEHSSSEASVEHDEEAIESQKAETAPAAVAAGGPATKYYYFYQSDDGQNIYLHPLNVKMLQANYGSLDGGPLIINARVVQKEQHSMDEDNRRKFTCLSHLPLTCQFAVVEVDLRPPIVGEGTLRLFKDDLLFRKKERQRREREERKRERHIDEINDRQMGKLIASTANLNLSSAHEFPTCGFEESLLTPDELDGIDSASSATPSGSHASYSAIAVTGSPQPTTLWPTLNSPPAHGHSHAGGAAQPPHSALVWGRQVPVVQPSMSASRRTLSVRSDEQRGSMEDLLAAPQITNLSDVLAQAMSQKKQQQQQQQQQQQNNTMAPAGGGKKQKRGKKMTPVFSTGMNFNGK